MKLTTDLDIQLQCRTPHMPRFLSDAAGVTTGKASAKSALKVVNPSAIKQTRLSVFVSEQSEVSWQAVSDSHFDVRCQINVQVLEDCTLENMESLPQLALIQLTKTMDKKTCELAASLRRKGCYVIMTGLAVNTSPEQAQKHADCLFLGDSKRNLKQFLADFHNNDQRRFYYSPWQQVESKASKTLSITHPACSH